MRDAVAKTMLWPFKAAPAPPPPPQSKLPPPEQALIFAGLAAVLVLLLALQRPSKGLQRPSWLPALGTEKRGYEVWALRYSVFWMGCFGLIIALELYESFDAFAYNVVCGGLALPLVGASAPWRFPCFVAASVVGMELGEIYKGPAAKPTHVKPAAPAAAPAVAKTAVGKTMATEPRLR